MAALWRGFHQDWIAYRADEAPRVVHAFKSTLAVILSMLVCMRLELRSPATAMVSTVIVMIHQQSGMVIARGFYRTLGFVCGSLAGLLLICLFAQQPVLFLAGLSVWLGIFVAGSSYYKNFQSYGFVLSGYAACITTVPEWSNPYDVTNNIIYTVSEVIIGVAAGSLVSALVFPLKVVPALVKWRTTALTSLAAAYRGAAQASQDDASVDAFVNLVKDSAAMEDLRTAAVFEEPEMRLRNETLGELDRAFVECITCVFALHRARQLTRHVDAATAQDVDTLFASLTSAVDDATSSDDFARLRTRLTDLERDLPHLIERMLRESADAGAIETAGAEVYLATSSLLEFCAACKVLLDPPSVTLTLPIAHAIAFMRTVPIRSSATQAFSSGVRAATAVGAVSVAWLASGWTNGYSAVVSAGITSGFFTLSPTPVTASWQAFIGCLIAVFASFFVNFMVMPGLGDVTLYALCLGIVLFVGSYVNTFPKYATVGALFSIYFLYVLTPTNVAVYNPPFLLDRGFALLTGIAASAVAFSLVLPREGERLEQRYIERIRGLVLDAAADPLDTASSVQIGRAIRDLILRISAVPNLPAQHRIDTTKWALGQFWISTAILQVRRLAASQADDENDWLRAMERVAENADAHAIDEAVTQTDLTLRRLQTKASGDARTVFQMRAWLFSTRAALTDRLPLALPSRTAVS